MFHIQESLAMRETVRTIVGLLTSGFVSDEPVGVRI